MYERALAIKPRYARALLNMGISQANLGMYEEAANFYLQALGLSPNARHIWNFLRVSLAGMERHDLVAKTKFEDVDLFLEDFPNLVL